NAWRNTKGTISVSTGKWYFEATYTGSQYGSGISNTVAGVGFAKTNVTTPNVDVNDSSLYGSILAFSQTGHVNNFNAPTSARSQIASGDVIGFALNYDAGTYTIYVNNTSTSSGSLNFTGELTPWTNAYYSGSYFILNTGQRPFAYTAPSGYKALCTQNLPEGTITTSGTFTGNASADGPFVYLNGVPTAMTINSNAVTFASHADKLSNGFKLRTSSGSYNTAGSNTYSITTTGDKFKYARAQPNP
ncbi:MAG: hypothetical protein EBQ98_04910, partial [Actinobacteria bacterium]|nr:hypothetical protein [Actinomycetota bacterium]